MAADDKENIWERAAQLPAAFINEQKAAQEILAAQRRVLLEPKETDIAEQDARNARAAILESKAKVNEILDFLTVTTQGSLDGYREEGNETAAADEAEELEELDQIRVQTLRYHEFLREYLNVTDSRPDHAYEILNIDIRKQYEQELAPLVQSYASLETCQDRRDGNGDRKAIGFP